MAQEGHDEDLRLLADSARDFAMIFTDPERNVVRWSAGAQHVLGWSEEEAIGKNERDLMFTPEDREAGVPQQEQSTALREGRAEAERWHIKKDGTRFFASGVMVPLFDPGTGALRGFGKVMRDITERKRLEEELRQTKEDLEERVAERTQELLWANRMLKDEAQVRKELLRRRLESAQEEERKRISRDLHDRAGQSLTVIKLGLAALGSASTGGLDLSPILAQVQQSADTLARDLHTLALELRPIALDDVGLPGALESYVEEWAERSGVTADFQSSGWGGVPRLANDIETTIYRVVQEALNNVVRHAQARQVSVVLERQARQVSAIVEDDGLGFDAEALLEAPATGGMERRLGLLGMQERAALVGGTLEIESSPGAGATVFLRIPLPQT